MKIPYYEVPSSILRGPQFVPFRGRHGISHKANLVYYEGTIFMINPYLIFWKPESFHQDIIRKGSDTPRQRKFKNVRGYGIHREDKG